MKLNKKAFTLIELLATIAILTIIGLIAVVSISNIITDNKNKQFINTSKEVIAKAKAKYILYDKYEGSFISTNENTCKTITMSNLGYTDDYTSPDANFHFDILNSRVRICDNEYSIILITKNDGIDCKYKKILGENETNYYTYITEEDIDKNSIHDINSNEITTNINGEATNLTCN